MTKTADLKPGIKVTINSGNLAGQCGTLATLPTGKASDMAIVIVDGQGYGVPLSELSQTQESDHV